VRGHWDVHSRAESESLLREYPIDDGAKRALAAALGDRLRQAAAEVCIPIARGEGGGAEAEGGGATSTAGKEGGGEGAVTTARALSRREFWRSLKLQSNVLLFSGLVEQAAEAGQGIAKKQQRLLERLSGAAMDASAKSELAKMQAEVSQSLV
jgi:hypothetical protein